jgi:hypothetical protein
LSQPSHIFSCPGTELQHLTVDIMHAGDLGTFQDALGSLFWLEVSHKDFHRNRKQGLERLNRDLNFYYAAHPERHSSRVTPVSMTQILSKVPGYPYLKAKAAQTRHLAHFGLQLAYRHRAGDGGRPPFRFRANHPLAAHSQQHCDLVVSLFEGFHGFVTSCSASPFSVATCRTAMYQYLQALQGLHDMWRVGVPLARWNKLPFHIRPKCHVCQHLVEEQILLFGSPSGFWCYRDEDFVGAMKCIANKTKHPATLEKRMIEKLRILAAVE